MSKEKRLLLFIVIILSAVILASWGCSSPYTSPEISKAVSAQAQAEEAKKQSVALERIATSLERIDSSINYKPQEQTEPPQLAQREPGQILPEDTLK
jgi:flagellar basal body-associated protein FliL